MVYEALTPPLIHTAKSDEESTENNLRRRAEKDLKRAEEAEAAGDANRAQEHRNQAYVKLAIAAGLAVLAATAAKAASLW